MKHGYLFHFLKIPEASYYNITCCTLTKTNPHTLKLIFFSTPEVLWERAVLKPKVALLI